MSGGHDDGYFDERVAARYDQSIGEPFEPAAIEAVVDFLVPLAGSGRALELGIGTGRIAQPLAGRGIPVHVATAGPETAIEVDGAGPGGETGGPDTMDGDPAGARVAADEAVGRPGEVDPVPGGQGLTPRIEPMERATT